MKKIIVSLLSVLIVAPAMAQDNYFFPAQKGAKLTYKFYNAKGKPLRDEWKGERWMTFAVDEVWPEEDGAVINVTVRDQAFDRLSKVKSIRRMMEDLRYGDVKIEGNVVTLDNMHGQGMITPYPDHFTYMASDRNISREDEEEGEDEGSHMSVELTAISTYPRDMKVGDTLPDQEIFNGRYVNELSEKEKEERAEMNKELDMEMRAMGFGHMGGLPSSDPAFFIKAKMKDRKVEAREKVTTPAGTFDCFRISYRIVAEDGMEGMGNVMMGMSGGGSFSISVMRADGEPEEPEGVKYVEWVSPEVGLVKREKYNARGKKIEETMVLEEYKK